MLFFPANLGFPKEPIRTVLPNFVYALHKAGKLFKSRPLTIDLMQRCVYLDRVRDSSHKFTNLFSIQFAAIPNTVLSLTQLSWACPEDVFPRPDLPLTQPGSDSRSLDGRLYILDDRWQLAPMLPGGLYDLALYPARKVRNFSKYAVSEATSADKTISSPVVGLDQNQERAQRPVERNSLSLRSFLNLFISTARAWVEDKRPVEKTV